MTYPAKPGIYTIAIAYRDYFGEGEKTPSYMTTVRKTIDPALIAAESITADKIDSAVADAIQSDVLSRVGGKIDTKVEVLQKNVLSRVDGKIDGKLGSLRTDLNGSIDAVRGNVQDLKRRADTLFGQVTGLKESVDGISSVVNDRVQKSVSGFVQRADRLEGMVKDATNSLSALSQRADTIESAVQTATQDREHIRSQLSSIQQTSAGIVSRVERVERDNEKQYEILHDIDNRENYHNNNLESRITQQADRITSVVGNLSSVESAKAAGYSAITQLQDAIGLKVSKGDVKSEVALGLQGVTLSGKQVHITGDTVIDKDVITKGMIQADCFSGIKMEAKNVFSDGLPLRPTAMTRQRLLSGERIQLPERADKAKTLVFVTSRSEPIFMSRARVWITNGTPKIEHTYDSKRYAEFDDFNDVMSNVLWTQKNYSTQSVTLPDSQWDPVMYNGEKIEVEIAKRSQIEGQAEPKKYYEAYDCSLYLNRLAPQWEMLLPGDYGDIQMSTYSACNKNFFSMIKNNADTLLARRAYIAEDLTVFNYFAAQIDNSSYYIVPQYTDVIVINFW